MRNKAKNISIAFLLILLCIQFSYYSTRLNAKDAEISAMKVEIKEKEAQYAAQEAAASRLLRQADELQAHARERGKAGLALIDSLSEIKTLAELIEAYQPRMDGAVSEGYGGALARLTEKEGLPELIGILEEKDASVAGEVSFLLFAEYVIQGNPKMVESMIRELEAINLKNRSDKEKAIIFALLEEAHSAKVRISPNL